MDALRVVLFRTTFSYPRSLPSGYAGLDPRNGKILWQDTVLHFPSLPLMDIYGDIIGSDGEILAQYRADGSIIQPVITLDPPMKDIFSLNLADNGILLLTSSFGVLTTYFTNGVPGGTVTLNYVMRSEPGVFVPLCSPVIRGHRSYMLTVFKPTNTSAQVNLFYRFFAIDLNDQFLEKIKVIWYLDLGPSPYENEIFNKRKALESSALDRSSLLVYGDLIFITTPNMGPRSELAAMYFWTVRDEGSTGSINFRELMEVDDLSIFNQGSAQNRVIEFIEKYDLKHSERRNTYHFSRAADQSQRKDIPRLLEDSIAVWGSDRNRAHIIQFNVTGSRVTEVATGELELVIKAPVVITSKIMTYRENLDSSDCLVLGVKVTNRTKSFEKLLNLYNYYSLNNSNYVISVKTSADIKLNLTLQWIIPVPGDGEVRGQIVSVDTGSGHVTDNSGNVLVAYSISSNSTKIFAIN